RDPALDARESLRQIKRLAGLGHDENSPVAELERELDAVGQARFDPLFEDEAIDHDVEIVCARPIELDLVAEIDDRPVDPNANEPVAAKSLELQFELALSGAND